MFVPNDLKRAKKKNDLISIYNSLAHIQLDWMVLASEMWV